MRGRKPLGSVKGVECRTSATHRESYPIRPHTPTKEAPLTHNPSHAESTANPWHIVDVKELDVETVRAVMGQVKVSNSSDHFTYREAELDTLWSIADMAVTAVEPGADSALQLLWEAHDLVGDGEIAEGVRALERLAEVLAEHGGEISLSGNS